MPTGNNHSQVGKNYSLIHAVNNLIGPYRPTLHRIVQPLQIWQWSKSWPFPASRKFDSWVSVAPAIECNRIRLHQMSLRITLWPNTQKHLCLISWGPHILQTRGSCGHVSYENWCTRLVSILTDHAYVQHCSIPFFTVHSYGISV